MKEYDLQVAVVKYLKWTFPDALYCASLGGIRTTFRQAVKAKATGYVKGHPDLFVYEPRGKYHGLALELKVKGNYATKEQKKWITKLNERGYYAVVTRGLDNTIEEIEKYLNSPL